MDCIIEKMTDADKEAIVQILNQAIAARGLIGILTETTVEKSGPWFAAHSPESYPLLVARKDGDTAGWIGLSPYRGGREALLGTVEVSYGVDAVHRRKGVGTQMLQQMITEARQRSYRVIVAVVFDTNEGTRRLLEKCGFQQWGHLPHVAQIDEKFMGHDYYGLLL